MNLIGVVGGVGSGNCISVQHFYSALIQVYLFFSLTFLTSQSLEFEIVIITVEFKKSADEYCNLLQTDEVAKQI